MNKRQKKKKMKRLRNRYSAEAYKTMYDAIYKKWREAEENVDALTDMLIRKDEQLKHYVMLYNMYKIQAYSHYGIGEPFREEKDDI